MCFIAQRGVSWRPRQDPQLWRSSESHVHLCSHGCAPLQPDAGCGKALHLRTAQASGPRWHRSRSGNRTTAGYGSDASDLFQRLLGPGLAGAVLPTAGTPRRF